MRVAVLMDNGFEELEAMGTIALLRRAGITVDLVSVTDTSVTGRFGVTYSPTTSMDTYDFEKADCLFVPGGAHYSKIEANEKACEWIRYFAKNKIIAAICAAPTILGRLGLLKGKNYTCFRSMNDDFGGTYHYQYAVVDGNIVTGVSAAASVEFAFALMEVLIGKEKTDACKESVYYDAAH